MQLDRGPKYYSRNGAQYADVMEWAKEFATSDRVVKQQRVWFFLFVSTVFLGLDHSFGEGPPLIFETMIFPCQVYQTRYTTEKQARKGHKRAVRHARCLPFVWVWDVLENTYERGEPCNQLM